MKFVGAPRACLAANKLIDNGARRMFEPKRASRDKLTTYIGARVTEAEEDWLQAEMKRRKLTMSDLIRLALSKFHGSKSEGPSLGGPA